ncbi:hypothetical protein E2562_017601 [Oryza meyeriana var. granulata]|uniref:Uncharacterized protein n=1 Tax=Oryza meyeriana var. granulata TaxID=110450 RepID=A0A6G1BLT7_9ORYZ|nr:hypothetical protein E2562_017601 [Oryza meyeriana var. granulata]
MSFLESLGRAWDLVEELQKTTLAGWVEHDEIRSARATEEAYLREGHQQLEVLAGAAKAVYDYDVAEVERERTAPDMERDEAVATREEAAKALKEL